MLFYVFIVYFAFRTVHNNVQCRRGKQNKNRQRERAQTMRKGKGSKRVKEREREMVTPSLCSLCYLPKSASLGSCVVFGVFDESFIGEVSELRLPSEDNDGGGE